MKLMNALWNDDNGVILSAELVLLGTLGVIGATVGLSVSATAVSDELQDFGFAMRSLDQSYSYSGFSNSRARIAGSSYVQEDVGTSLEKLRIHRVEAEHRAEEMREEWRDRARGTLSDDDGSRLNDET